MTSLTPAQVAAVGHVRRTALRDRGPAVERAAAVLAAAGVDATLEDLARWTLDRRRIALNFHPDRIAGDGRTVAGALLDDGRSAPSVVREPGRWADHATPAETLQHLEQLWHVLVRYGRPATLTR